MKIKRFRDWSLFWKGISISIATLLIVLIAIVFYFIPLMKKNMVDEKLNSLRNLTDIAYALMVEYNERANKGEFTQEEAQNRAKARIRNIRYMEKEYFWINDMQPKMIMHPIKPELDGKDLSDNKDPNGKRLFIEFVKVCKKDGAGYVNYMWSKPGSQKPVPKLSYVRLFKPWDWIVGTGVYIDNIDRQMNALKIQIFIGTLVCFGIIIGLSLFIARINTLPIVRGMETMRQVSDGDLTIDIAVDSTDEIGHLLLAISEMVHRLRDMIATIKISADGIATSSEELSANSRQISGGISEQAGRAAQIATASTEMSQTASDIAQNTSFISESVVTTAKVASEGAAIVHQSVDMVRAIAGTVQESSQFVTSLGERSMKIGDIISVINDIADQTNLLALNAAIEAARAGEQGRGFAVVADEVRKLAERTSKATSEISEMIGSIQKEVKATVNSMNEVTEKVNTGVTHVTKAGDSLRDIVQNVDNLQGLVQSIATATEEMSSVSDTIQKDIEAVANISNEASAGSGQIAQSAADLAQLSIDLQQIIAHFKV
ncbi:MAG: methyl-accepting chemotaxis protein [Nitrospirae bacterium]|uniref:methyl-accepting chemotaxis protein n=1 Tax=Candidatus Magnetobacterium casense TaxID=1455061 RepID=UPI00058B9147|nr:methyl-accepting chemotaxis protein [Candidatus Magnetobacterium casensis]MBF0338971.1 methyl-accepting chemotaxis protein [Nitrospirota bacterium]